MNLSDYLHREPVREWAEGLTYTTLAAGHQLVIALGSPDPTPAKRYIGIGDNVAMASDLLRDLETRGWVKRGAYEPGRDLKFFGLGGGPSKGYYACEYCWSTTPAGTVGLSYWLDPICETHLHDGTILLGKVQGDAGVPATVTRLVKVLNHRLATADQNIPFAGQVSVWTDPENEDSERRLTKVSINQIAKVTVGGGWLVWRGPEPATADVADVLAWFEGAA